MIIMDDGNILGYVLWSLFVHLCDGDDDDADAGSGLLLF